MGLILTILQFVVWLVSLVCFILIVIQMFKHGETGMGIACLVLTLCALGPLLALIYGWMKAGQWGITNLMATYTGAFVVGTLLSIAGQTMAR